MNIEYLKYFAELAKVQHYGKAAKILNISQPGLSHAIKTLEEECGVPLFQREGRNVSLSSYGKELMKDVDDILNAYLRLEERAAGLRTEEKTVRIGTVYPLAAGMVPRMLQKFGATFPFVVYNRLTPEIAEGLMDGKYDIGFCSDLLKSEELEYYPIRESYIAVVVPKGHPLEKRESISLKEVALYPQIMFSKTSGFRNLQEQIFDKEGIKVRPVCTAEEIEVITGLVENGFGISVLPYMDIIRHHNIVAIPVQTSIWKSKFYIARRKYGIRSDQEGGIFSVLEKKQAMKKVFGNGSVIRSSACSQKGLYIIHAQSLSKIGLFLAFQNNYFTAVELQHSFWTIGAVLIGQKHFFYRIFKSGGNGFATEVGGNENAL